MKKEYYSFVGIYTFTYAAIGMLMPLLGQYLAGIGFTGIQIGIITASGTAIGIGASPFWGYRSHHSRDSSRILLFLCIVTTMILLGMVFVKIYLAFLFIYVVFSFFQTPIMPLTDAMTLEARVSFGAARKWGALGFAAGVFFAGQLAEAISLAVIFPLCAFGYTVAWIIMIRLRKRRVIEKQIFTDRIIGKQVAADTSKKSEKIPGDKRGSYRVLLRNKRLMAFLFSAFFIYGTNVANNTYFGFLYTDVGGSVAGIGLAFLLMCSAEAPFMAWADRLSKKFTMEKLILAAMILSAVRYLWYSTGPAPELLIGTFFIQGVVNGIILVEFVRYITKLVEPATISMAMTLYQAVSSNCSSILCQLIGGTILDHFGGIQVYLFFSIYNAVGILLYIGFGLYKRNQVLQS